MQMKTMKTIRLVDLVNVLTGTQTVSPLVNIFTAVLLNCCLAEVAGSFSWPERWTKRCRCHRNASAQSRSQQ